MEVSLYAKTHLDSSIRFDTILVCDGQANGHTTTAYCRAVKMCVMF